MGAVGWWGTSDLLLHWALDRYPNNYTVPRMVLVTLLAVMRRCHNEIAV